MLGSTHHAVDVTSHAAARLRRGIQAARSTLAMQHHQARPRPCPEGLDGALPSHVDAFREPLAPPLLASAREGSYRRRKPVS